MASNSYIDFNFKGPSAAAFDRAFEKMFDDGMDKLLQGIEKSWREKANNKLDTSKKEYLDNIKFDREKDTITVSLNGWLPVVVESGSGPFDMKPGLLRGHGSSRAIPIGKPFKYFRTVSVNSPKDSWIWKEHKHQGGAQINKEMHDEINQTLIPEIFGDLISRMKI